MNVYQILRRRYELDMRDALGRLKANVYETKQANNVLRLYTLRLWRRHLATAMDKWARVTALKRRHEAGIKQIYACLCRTWKRRCKARLTKAWWKWLQVLTSQRQWQQQTARVRGFQIYWYNSVSVLIAAHFISERFWSAFYVVAKRQKHRSRSRLGRYRRNISKAWATHFKSTSNNTPHFPRCYPDHYCASERP